MVKLSATLISAKAGEKKDVRPLEEWSLRMTGAPTGVPVMAADGDGFAADVVT